MDHFRRYHHGSKAHGCKRPILHENARADNRTIHGALTATERRADARASREATIATVAEAIGIYHSAIEELVSQIGEETTAELVGADAISVVHYATR
ncbi:MAG: hypothetical protein ACP5HZ_10715 [Ferrimicrobium sp.]